MSTKTCSICGASMVLRTASRGRFKGQQFWGCRRFPDCRQIEPVTDADVVQNSNTYQINKIRDHFTSRPESEVITISRISTAACPFAYYKAYVEYPRQEPAFTSMEIAIGLYVHDAAERLFQEARGLKINEDLQLSCQLVDNFAREYLPDKEPIAPYRIVRADRTGDDYLILLSNLLANFNQFVIDRLSGHLSVEAEGALELETDKVVIRGKYDLITKDPAGQLILWDWKTGRAPNKAFADSTEQLDMQLAVYGTWMRHKFHDEHVQGSAVFLQDQSVTVDWTYRAEQEQATLRHLCTWREKLNSWTDYPPAPGGLCVWCGWNTVCPTYSYPA